MMNNGCVAGCTRDAKDPVKRSSLKQYQWPESDAKFLMRRIADMKKEERERNPSLGSEISFKFEKSPSCGSEISACSPIDEGFACSRQKYLRSYPFTRREDTVAEKIKRLFKKKQNGKKKAKKVNDGSWSYIDACLKFILLCVAKVDVHTERPTSKTSV